ncbi:MAG: hypothetical protein J6W64_05210 [Bacilli bacterium]|nr:hypothetical protein [Bacilli bacterium]
MLTDLQGMLTRSFNIDLGSINISKFNTELAQSKYSLQDMYTSFSKAGSQGQVAFNQMVSQVANSNLKLK